MPSVKPMLAMLGEDPFDGKEWLFETKYDGFRTIAYIQDDKVKLESRNELSFNHLFPEIVKELKELHVDAILDGEVVVLDKKGRSSFQGMQNIRIKPEEVYYYVFDILYLNGYDLRNQPLIKRKDLLKELLPLKHVLYSTHILYKGKKAFQAATKNGEEGIIAKKIESLYEGKRSSDWIKIKSHLSQEAVICGFTEPRGSRKKFGALILGVYRGGVLEYIGHTGGGFDASSLEAVYNKMKPLIQTQCPFINPPKPNAPVTWVKPKLVCDVTFGQWTSEGIMRQPIFKGLREDKSTKEVGREMENSNVDKLYWPKEGYTKGDLIEYYQEIAPTLLPYLKNRPVMLKRYPDGIVKEGFVQKDVSKLHLPSWVETLTIKHEVKPITYILINNKETLNYVNNLGVIEIHPFLSEKKDLEDPTFLVIDLDPETIPFSAVIETVQEVHAVLDELQVKNFCKTSGKDGLHIYIPVHAKYSFEQVKHFGELIAALVHQRLPKITSLERKPINRQKKVYLDVYQNNYGQTVVAPYTVRALPKAPVSTPLEWDEVQKGLDPKDFTIKNTLSRVKKLGDIFKPVLGAGIDIKKVIKKIQ